MPWVPGSVLQHPLGAFSTKTPSSLALILPTALLSLSTVVIHRLLWNVTGKHCLTSMQLSFFAVIILCHNCVSDCGEGWSPVFLGGRHRMPLRCRIMGSSPDLEAGAGVRGVRASAPAWSSASPLSLLTRVPISVSCMGSWWRGHLCTWAMQATASLPLSQHSCQTGTVLLLLTCAPSGLVI